MRAPALCALVSLALAACDSPRPPPASTAGGRVDASPAPPPPPPTPPADRVVTRTLLSYYHWLRSDAPLPGETSGVEHARVDLTLVVEVHRNPAGEGWVTVGALGPDVDVPEHRYLRAEGAVATWHVPSGAGFTDPRKEPFGGQFRSDEPVRAWLAAQPDGVVTVTPGRAPEPLRLPTTGTLPVTPTSGAGQYSAVVIAVLPMQNRGGRRYLLQALDLAAQPGGFGQNGVMDHVPTRAEVDRYLTWMRDPRGRRPPVAALPIDRS